MKTDQSVSSPADCPFHDPVGELVAAKSDDIVVDLQ